MDRAFTKVQAGNQTVKKKLLLFFFLLFPEGDIGLYSIIMVSYLLFSNSILLI